jgi:hypothetical protein
MTYSVIAIRPRTTRAYGLHTRIAELEQHHEKRCLAIIEAWLSTKRRMPPWRYCLESR